MSRKPLSVLASNIWPDWMTSTLRRKANELLSYSPKFRIILSVRTTFAKLTFGKKE